MSSLPLGVDIAFFALKNQCLQGELSYLKTSWKLTSLLQIPMQFAFTLEIQAHFIQPTSTNEELMNHRDTGSNK